MTEWIIVEDEMPEDNGIFLCATHAGTILMHHYSVEEGWKSISGKDAVYWNAVTTHWMPLPEPPEDK